MNCQVFRRSSAEEDVTKSSFVVYDNKLGPKNVSRLRSLLNDFVPWLLSTRIVTVISFSPFPFPFPGVV